MALQPHSMAERQENAKNRCDDVLLGDLRCSRRHLLPGGVQRIGPALIQVHSFGRLLLCDVSANGGDKGKVERFIIIFSLSWSEE